MGLFYRVGSSFARDVSFPPLRRDAVAERGV
jgi:hypothetical protein